MRTPTFSFAAGFVLTMLALAPVAAASPAFFAVGGVYRDGRMSEGERELRAVLKRHEARAQFTSQLGSGSIVSQLYALLGLRLTDRAAFERALPSFSHRRDRVPCMFGCTGLDEEVGRIAERIARGLYDEAFTSPPR